MGRWDTPFPCGRRNCIAALRLFWDDASISNRKIGEYLGRNAGWVQKTADRAGLPPRGKAFHYKRVPVAAIKRAWLNRTKSVESLAEGIGIHARTLAIRAKDMGLGDRPSGPIKRSVIWPEDFKEMWEAGVMCREIMRACERPPSSSGNVTTHAKRLKLKGRGPGPKKNALTLAQYRMMKDAEAVRAKVEATWRAVA